MLHGSSLRSLGALAGLLLGGVAAAPDAAAQVSPPYAVLHHYGYYNPHAYQPRYLYYPFVGGGAYPWYDYQPYYGWSIVPGRPPARMPARLPPLVVNPETDPGPAAAADAPAHLTLRVPADARVWFNGAPTKTTGAVREYDSPPLAPGERYTYRLRVRWNDRGREVEQSREVSVTAGARVTLEFPAATHPNVSP
jgi:uncharacterized protein (TIGR03000 family)